LRPGPDEDDLRNFEWRYWDRQMHAELSAAQLSGPPPSEGRGGFNYSPRRIIRKGGSRGAGPPHTRSEFEPAPKGLLGLVWDAATGKLLMKHSIPDDHLRDDILADCNLSFSRDGKRLGITANAWVARPSRVRYRRQAVDVDTGKALLDLVNDGEPT